MGSNVGRPRSPHHPANRGSKEMKILTKYSTKGPSRSKTFYREMSEKLRRVGKRRHSVKPLARTLNSRPTWRTCILSVFNSMYLGCLTRERVNFGKSANCIPIFRLE